MKVPAKYEPKNADVLAGSKRSRSVVIERAIRNELRQRSSSFDDADDLERITTLPLD